MSGSGRRKLKCGQAKGSSAHSVWGLWALQPSKVWQLGSWDVGLDLRGEVGKGQQAHQGV